MKSRNALIITVLSAIILLAFGLRLYRLDAKSLWADEGLSMYRAHKDLPFILSNTIIIQGVVTEDLQPPLYFILLRFLIEFAGDSEFAAKFLSGIFSVLTVPLLYTVGKKLFNRQVGLFASFLGASSPLYLWYSQELRMYTMLIFLGLLSVYTLLKVMEGNDSAEESDISKWAWRCGYVLTTVAMLYTHYSAFFMLLFEFVVFLTFAITGRKVWSVILLLAALSALPLVPFALHRMQLGPEPSYRFVPLSIILRDLLNSFSLGISVSLRRVFWLDMIFLAVFVVGLLLSDEGKPELWFRKSLLLLGYLFVPTLALYLASYIRPLYMGARHLIIVSPAYYLILAAGLVSLKRLWRPALALCLIVFLAGFAYSTRNYFFDERYIKDDLRSMFRYVERHSQPGDIVVLSDAVICHVFDYYHRGGLPWTSLPRYGTPFTLETIAEIQKLSDQYERIWFAYGPSGAYYEPTAPLAKEWLDDNLFKADDRAFHGYGTRVALACYLSQLPILDQPPPLQEKVGANLAHKLALLGYELPRGPVAGGEVLHVDLYWQALGEVDEDYHISAWLVDDEGHVCGHGDSEPFNSLHPTSQWEAGKVLRETHELPVQWGTPPGGSYKLEVEMYSPQTGRPLEVFDENGIPQRTRVPLGAVNVIKPTHPPSAGELPIQHRRRFDLDGQIAVLGYDCADKEAGPGDALHLSLYYLARRKPEDDYRLNLQLVDEGGEVWVEEAFSPGGDSYPTTLWDEGEVVKGQYRLIVPADAPAGQYRLRARMYAAATGELLPVRRFWLLEREFFDLSSLRIVQRERRFETPSIQHPRVANLGDRVGFLGYDLEETTVAPGGTLHLTLHWRCERRMETSYTVFTHLLDGESRIWGQRDSIPAGGTRPTTGWIEGEIIADRYEIPVKPETPGGEYVLEIGMYDKATGERLPVFNEAGEHLPEDRILLEEVGVSD